MGGNAGGNADMNQRGDKLKQSRKDFEAWKKLNPNTPIKTKIKQGLQFAEKGLGIRVTLGTLPSLIIPTPKRVADKIDAMYDDFRKHHPKLRR